MKKTYNYQSKLSIIKYAEKERERNKKATASSEILMMEKKHIKEILKCSMFSKDTNYCAEQSKLNSTKAKSHESEEKGKKIATTAHTPEKGTSFLKYHTLFVIYGKYLRPCVAHIIEYTKRKESDGIKKMRKAFDMPCKNVGACVLVSVRSYGGYFFASFYSTSLLIFFFPSNCQCWATYTQNLNKYVN